jgi:sec-independent protein translocase protein TatA
MPAFGPTELVIVLVIALVIFGPGKLSDLGSSLGKSIREFRSGVRDRPESSAAQGAESGAEGE